MTPRPDLPSIPIDPDNIPHLRTGHRVRRHIYLVTNPLDHVADEPLFTVPDGIDPQMIVDGLEALRWLNLNPEVTP